MGVRVRTSRNTSVWLPWWLALPACLLVVAVYACVAVIFVVVMAIIGLAKVLVAAGRALTRLGTAYSSNRQIGAGE